MRRITKFLAVAALLGGGVAVAGPALAQTDPPPEPTDPPIECPYECPYDGDQLRLQDREHMGDQAREHMGDQAREHMGDQARDRDRDCVAPTPDDAS